MTRLFLGANLQPCWSQNPSRGLSDTPVKMVDEGNAESNVNQNVNDFLPIPVTFNEKSRNYHHLYIKNHATEGHESKPTNRTLFIANVPSYCDAESLKLLFSDCGLIKKVFFHQKPSSGIPDEAKSKYFTEVKPIEGFKVAYVVFQNKIGLQKALKLHGIEPRYLSTVDHKLTVGIEKWCKQFNEQITNDQELEKEVETFMMAYDERVVSEERKEKETEGLPDDEGWIKVTRHSKKPVIPRVKVTGKKISAKKRARNELLNFYTFQIKRTKLDHITQLRKKFEEDKKRIEIMKDNRKFKPC